MDDRVDLLLGGDKSPGRFDKAELSKLPPFNDFIRQNIVESMDDIQPKMIPDSIFNGQAKLRPVPTEIADIKKAIKEISTRKKRELLENKESKDKKAAPAAPAKGQPGKVETQESDAASKKAYIENTKIELKENMVTITEFPQYYPTVSSE